MDLHLKLLNLTSIHILKVFGLSCVSTDSSLALEAQLPLCVNGSILAGTFYFSCAGHSGTSTLPAPEHIIKDIVMVVASPRWLDLSRKHR